MCIRDRADEHTGNLDAATGREMQTLFNDVARSTGQTVLMVTHSQVVAEAADRVVEMVDGCIQPNSEHKPEKLPQNTRDN